MSGKKPSKRVAVEEAAALFAATLRALANNPPTVYMRDLRSYWE